MGKLALYIVDSQYWLNTLVDSRASSTICVSNSNHGPVRPDASEAAATATPSHAATELWDLAYTVLRRSYLSAQWPQCKGL
jgi:hypothetical protein